MHLLWMIANLGQGTALVLWSMACIFVALFLRLVGWSPHLPLVFTRSVWAPVAVALFGVRLEVLGREHVARDRPQLFVSNHRSNLDAAVIYAAIPRNLRFLVKSQIKKVPLLGWYVSAMGMVYVDRESRASARESVLRSISLLADGHALLSFPEATRNVEAELKPFKRGIFGVAIAAGADVVPIALSGTDAVWPPGGLSVRPGAVVVEFGEPIPTADLHENAKVAVAERARDAITALRERRLAG